MPPGAPPAPGRARPPSAAVLTVPHRLAGLLAGRLVACAATALLLCACVQRGDFGRVPSTTWNDGLGVAGELSARGRDEPVSPFPLTDDERDLRQRAWRFLTPASAYPLFARWVSDLAVLRVLPAAWHPSDPALYYDGLVAEPFRSPASRYRRIADDIVADGRLAGDFATLAARVAQADAVRLRGIPLAATLGEADIRAAEARVAENRGLVAWVGVEARARVEAYRYALEHLFLAAPQGEAIAPERALAGLRERIALLDVERVLKP